MIEELNKEIEVILKKHIEGKPFFDALDMMIRSKANILKIAMNHLISNTLDSTNDKVLILTGEIGKVVSLNYNDILCKHFRAIILLPGGLSKISWCKVKEYLTPNINVLKVYADADYYVFDDSYYSGQTVDNIAFALFDLANIQITKTIVVYDGSINRSEYVVSLFRYHN